MKINWNQLKSHSPIIAITILATILRFVALYRYGDFWDDEIFNFIYSQKAWPHGLTYWLWETNPPLHLLILKIWLYIFPATEFFTRLPSLIAGVASVIAINKLGKTLFNRNTGLIAAFYLAIHPYHIYWSATARIYVFLMLLVILSTYFFYQRFFSDDTDKQNNNRTYRLSTLTNFLLIFSHLTSIFFLAGQFILLITLKGKTETFRWIKENLIPFSVGGLWIIASFWIKIDNHLEQSWFLNMRQTFQNSLSPLLNLLVGQQNYAIGLIIFILIVPVIGYAFYKETKQGKIQPLALLILTLFPILLAAAFNVWHIKFFLCILPLFILIIVWSITDVFKNQKILSFIIFLICASGLINLWDTLPLTNWKNVDTYLKSKPANTVLIYNNYILKTQIDRYLPSLSNTSVPLILYPDLSWDDMIVKKNYIFITLTNDEKDKWYNANQLNNFSSLVLLQGEYGPMNKLNNILTSHGWRLTKGPENAKIYGEYNLYWYEKN